MIDTMKKECIRIAGSTESKGEMLREIAGLAKKCPTLEALSEEEIFRGLSAREELHSTGLAEGIAIPHCSFDSIKEFVVGLVVVPEGMDFKSLDGKKSRFLFFIIGPTAHRNRHIKILSSISLLSREPEKLEKLAAQTTPEGILQVLRGEAVPEVPEQGKERCQITVYLQDEDLFESILEVLSSDTEGAVAVIESVNAGYYLNRLPLFSSFWSESDTSWSRIILSIIDKRLANETVRRINMIRKPDTSSGLLITVQDMLYSEGALDF